jgi:hypothetical protein
VGRLVLLVEKRCYSGGPVSDIVRKHRISTFSSVQVDRLVGLDSPMLEVAQTTQSTRLAMRWFLESLPVVITR